MADPSLDMVDVKAKLSSLWELHVSADWPVGGDAHEGELMTLDTVVAGCATYYIDEQELDAQRVVILQDCLDELENLMPDLDPEAQEYFERLQQLGELLIKLGPVA